jgi:hypothetical protein
VAYSRFGGLSSTVCSILVLLDAAVLRVLRVNPISAIFPGVTRKIMEFNTGKQKNAIEFPNN